jgi:hypothetical protein
MLNTVEFGFQFVNFGVFFTWSEKIKGLEGDLVYILADERSSGSFKMLGTNFLPLMQHHIPPEWNLQQIYWKIISSSLWEG